MSIREHLNKIRNAIYGREVREAIAKGIEETYNDASEKHDNANMEVKMARGTHSNLNNRLDDMEETDQEVTAQLAQKVGGGKLATLNDLDEETLNFIHDGTGGPVTVESVPKDKSVTPEKTTFIETSSNLLDRERLVKDRIISADGTISENTSYFYSHKINVSAGETIFYRYVINLSFYDENDNFIERVIIPNPESGFVEVPDNAGYARANIRSVDYVRPTERPLQISISDVEVPYEPYWARLDDVEPAVNSVDSEHLSELSVTNDKLGLASVEGKNILNETITPEKTTFIKEGNNLYNPNNHTLGYVISDTGEITENKTYGYTEKIPVTPGETMQSAGFNMLATYDINGNFISRQYIDAPGYEFVIPEDVYFLAYNFQLASGVWNNEPRIYKGDVLLPYEPYSAVLDGVSLSDEGIEDVGEKLKLIVSDRFMFDLPTDQLFKADGLPVDDWSDFGTSTKSDEVYAKFDELQAAYPDYITKTPLQPDAFGNEIALYEFNPKRADTSVDTKIPTAFWTLGTHGYEHVPALMFYLMLKRMLENWRESEALEILRFNVRFLVIPVVNPSGWDDYTRKTRNGVDIARNFPENWTESDISSGTYGGTEPLSEIESQNVSKVIKEHPEIDMMYDFHNFSGAPDTDYFIWIPTSSGSYVQHMAQKLIGRMTHTWQKDYSEWMPQGYDWYAGYTDNTSGGMIQDHALGNGIKFAATFEVAGRWWLEDPENTGSLLYNMTHRKTGLETLVNWMLINLEELNFK